METNDASNNEIILIAVQQMAEELQSHAREIHELAVLVKDAKNNDRGAADIAKHFENFRSALTHMGTQITGLRSLIERNAAPVTRKIQVLLFPEQDRKLFYRIVFGRWLLYLVIMLFLNHLYQWAIHNSDNQKAVQLEQLQQDRVYKAWDYLYKNGGGNVKKQMENAYSQSMER